MINNSFQIIGTATTNYREPEYQTSYPIKLLDVEVEKLFSKNAKTQNVQFYIYMSNTRIDTSVKVYGHKILVGGYIDTYYNKESNSIITKLVADSILVLDYKPKQVNDSYATSIKEPSESSPIKGTINFDDGLPY